MVVGNFSYNGFPKLKPFVAINRFSDLYKYFMFASNQQIITLQKAQCSFDYELTELFS